MDCPAPALALGLGWAFSAMAHPGSKCRPSGAPRVSRSVLLGPSPLHKNSSSSQNPVESRQFWLPGHWGLLMPEHHPQAPGGWTWGPRVQLLASSSASRRLRMGHAELRKSCFLSPFSFSPARRVRVFCSPSSSGLSAVMHRLSKVMVQG